jgi:uracil-DNA glycosylase
VHILDVPATLQLAAEIKQIDPAIFVAVGGHAAASYPKALEQSWT